MGKNIKIALASLIALLLLFPTNVMANDTRNRVFNYTTMIRTTTVGTHYIHPYETTTSNNQAKAFTDTYHDSLATVNIQKNKIETSYVTLNQYQPALGQIIPIYDLMFGLQLSGNLTTEEINGTSYTKAYNLHRTGLTPNTAYTGLSGPVPFQYIWSTERKQLTTPNTRNYGKYYSKALNSDMGLRNDNTGMNDRVVPGFTSGGTINLANGFYTPADDPSIIVSSVTTNAATISWSTNNTNPASTSYALQYRKLTGTDINNEGHWGSWTIIPVGGSNNTTAVAVTTSIFQPENTYQLRVRVNHVGGSSYDVYSDYVIFSTTADPAVRAAQEAAIAAQAAKKAAEDSVQYSLDAKSAAEDVRGDVRHPEYGLEAISNKIYNSTPFIQKIFNPGKATVTLSNEFEIKINAAGVQENLVYRVQCDSFDSGWTRENLIKIKGLNETGIKKAIITVSNNPSAPEKGATVEDEFTFFKAGF